jgi:hypothetical protein
MAHILFADNMTSTLRMVPSNNLQGGALMVEGGLDSQTLKSAHDQVFEDQWIYFCKSGAVAPSHAIKELRQCMFSC